MIITITADNAARAAMALLAQDAEGEIFQSNYRTTGKFILKTLRRDLSQALRNPGNTQTLNDMCQLIQNLLPWLNTADADKLNRYLISKNRKR